MTFRFIHATFEAREVEQVTGVSTQLQREWRRRGFFERSGEGRAEHDVRDLARLLVMRLLGRHGIGPSMSADIAASVALRIEFFAHNLPTSVEDATGGEFERAFAKSGRSRGSMFGLWGNSKSWGNSKAPERFLLVGADGVVSFANDLKQALSDTSFEGAVVVLDLEALGTTIAKRAGQPLVTVELSKGAA